jgi:predicted RNA-binding Zn ribbon-like protein
LSTPAFGYAGVVDVKVVERFLNTLDERSFTSHGRKHVPGEKLTSADALSNWLETEGLNPAGQQLQPADLAAAVSLRAALREALTDGTHHNEALAGYPLRLTSDPAVGLRLTATGTTPGLAAIVETVAQNVADGGWTRLKLCAATDCRWAFYDASRNAAGRWCSMNACGNRHKTRAYRDRNPS